MESQKTTIELKLSLAELDLILDALDAYPFDLRKFVPANRILVVK